MTKWYSNYQISCNLKVSWSERNKDKWILKYYNVNFSSYFDFKRSKKLELSPPLKADSG